MPMQRRREKVSMPIVREARTEADAAVEKQLQALVRYVLEQEQLNMVATQFRPGKGDSFSFHSVPVQVIPDVIRALTRMSVFEISQGSVITINGRSCVDLYVRPQQWKMDELQKIFTALGWQAHPGVTQPLR